MLKALWRHRVTKNTGALAIVQLVSYLVPFLVLVYLTRTLGVETYGVVAFSVGMTQLAIVVLDFGFTLSATQKISVWRDRKTCVARLTGAIFWLKGVGFLAVACAVAVYAAFTEKYAEHSALFLLSLLPMLGQCFQPIWLFAAIERMRYITLVLVVAKILSLIFILMFVSDERHYLWVPLADGIAQLCAAALAIGLVYAVGYRLAVPRRRDIRYAAKLTSGYFASRMAATAYLSSGVLLLGLFASSSTVAVYSLAEQLYRAIQSVFAPVVQAIYPYMAKEKNLALLAKTAIVCCSVAAVGAAVGYFVAPALILQIFGAQWHEAIPVFAVFLLAITIHVMTVMSGYPLAAAMGRLDVANRSTVYGSFIYMLSATVVLLSGNASPVAFAWLMVVAELYVLLHRAAAFWPQLARLHAGRT